MKLNRHRMIRLWVLWFCAVTLLVLIVGVGGFALLEGHGLTHEDSITLSRLTWEISQAWPPFLPLVSLIAGLLIGGFFVGFIFHITWHWNPEDARDLRG